MLFSKALLALLALAAGKAKAPAAPYSAEAFKAAYQDFVLHPPKVTDGLVKDAAEYFHDADTLKDVRATAKKESVFLDPIYAPQKALTDDAIRTSVDDPVLVSGMLRQSWQVDHTLLFRGDVYVDSYFHNFADGKRIFRGDVARLDTWDKLVRSEPYLEWSADDAKFVFHASGAGERLLGLLGRPEETVTLYRGTAVSEAKLFKLASDADGRSLTKSEITALRELIEGWRGVLAPEIAALRTELVGLEDGKGQLSKADSAALLTKVVETYQLTQLSSTYGQAFFASPNQGVARFFQNFYDNRESTTVKYTFKLRDLQKLVADRKLYVGLENGSLELAFFHPDAVKALLEAWKPAK